MKNKRITSISVKKNIVFNTIVQILTYAIPLITAPYTARVLTPAGVGTFSYANSIVSYFSLVIAFGFMDYGIKRIAESKEDIEQNRSVFWSIFFSRILLFLAVISIYFILLFTLGFEEDKQLSLYSILSVSILSTAIDVTYLYKGLENYRQVSLVSLLVRIIEVVLLFLIVKSQDDLLLYAILVVATSLITNLILLFMAFGTIGKPKFDIKEIWHSIKESFFFFLPTIATTIFSTFDITTLGALSTKEQVGYYEEAYKVVTMVRSLTLVYCPILIARMSALTAQKKTDELRLMHIKFADFFGLITFPCFFGVIAVNKYFIPLFFGKSYMESVPVLYILSGIIVFSTLSYSLCCSYYVPNGKINYITVFEFIAAGLNVLGNILLLKFTDLGAKGVAITSCATEFLMVVFTILWSMHHIPLKEMAKKLIKPLLASGIMFVLIFVFNYFLENIIASNAWMLVADIAIGVVSYGLLVILFKDEIVIGTLHNVKNKIKSRGKQK